LKRIDCAIYESIFVLVIRRERLPLRPFLPYTLGDADSLPLKEIEKTLDLTHDVNGSFEWENMSIE